MCGPIPIYRTKARSLSGHTGTEVKKNFFGNFENRILQKFRSSLQIDNSDNLENIWNSGKLEISFKIETHKIEVACTQLPEVQDYEFIRF